MVVFVNDLALWRRGTVHGIRLVQALRATVIGAADVATATAARLEEA